MTAAAMIPAATELLVVNNLGKRFGGFVALELSMGRRISREPLGDAHDFGAQEPQLLLNRWVLDVT